MGEVVDVNFKGLRKIDNYFKELSRQRPSEPTFEYTQRRNTGLRMGAHAVMHTIGYHKEKQGLSGAQLWLPIDTCVETIVHTSKPQTISVPEEGPRTVVLEASTRQSAVRLRWLLFDLLHIHLPHTAQHETYAVRGIDGVDDAGDIPLGTISSDPTYLPETATQSFATNLRKFARASRAILPDPPTSEETFSASFDS